MNEKSPPRKLTRSRNDRYIGGVAAGIADHFNFDPVFARIAFVASLALGGLGLLAYMVLLAVMPIEGDPSEPLPPVEPKRRNLMIGLTVVVGIIGIAAADSGNFASWLFGFWPGTVFGILLWVAAGAAAIWLLLKGTFEPAGSSFPDADPKPAPPSTEVVTYAQSPSQLSTEVMKTRELHPGSGDGPAGPDAGTSGSRGGSSRQVHDSGGATVGKIMLWFAIGLMTLIVFCLLFVFSAGATAIFGGVPMAALVIVLGAGMVFAGVRGRRQLSIWLLTAAIAVTLPMAAISIADLRIEGSYGDINETPLSVADIPEDGYRMAAGNMTIDLRKFNFVREARQQNHPGFELPVRSGIGLTSVVVPDDVCVTGSVHAKAGVISFRGRQSNGLDVTQNGQGLDELPHPNRSALRVNLDGEVKLGAFEVVDNTQWRSEGRAGSFDENDLEPSDSAAAAARRRAAAACAGPSDRKNDKADSTREKEKSRS